MIFLEGGREGGVELGLLFYYFCLEVLVPVRLDDFVSISHGLRI